MNRGTRVLGALGSGLLIVVIFDLADRVVVKLLLGVAIACLLLAVSEVAWALARRPNV